MSIADQNNGNQGSAAFNFNNSGSPTGATLDPPPNSNFNLSGDASNVTVIGSDETINLTPDSGSLLGVEGAGDVVTGNSGSNEVGLVGVGTSATVSGTGFVGLNQSDETLTLTSSGAVAGTMPDVTGETINGIGVTVDPAAASVVTTIGNNNTVNLTGTAVRSPRWRVPATL